MINKIHQGDVLEVLKTWPDEFVDCVVTSPPYWQLRDYGVTGQIGLEPTPEEYIAKMTEVFREVRRVLKKDGTCWVNMGDSYASNEKGSGGHNPKQDSNAGSWTGRIKLNHGIKPKDLCGIPWLLAFALRADGWWLRQDIIWSKPNPMPESVTDRCTKAHEYIFLLSKSAKYYYDAEAVKEDSCDPIGSANRYKSAFFVGDKHESGGYSATGAKHTAGLKEFNGTRNRRSVWTVATEPTPEAHFATFPRKLIEPCILAGSPKNGLVLDPFMGSGTTAIVAFENGRNFIGIELNPEYINIAHKRLSKASNQLTIF